MVGKRRALFSVVILVALIVTFASVGGRGGNGASEGPLNEAAAAAETGATATTTPVEPPASEPVAETITGQLAPLDPSLSPDERFVDALSRVFLDRPATQVELDAVPDELNDAQRTALTVTAVEASPWINVGFALDATTADSFYRAGSTAESFVEGLYERYIGRAPDDEGRAYWIEQLTTGAASPESVVAQFRTTSEYREARVIRVYDEVLGRAPDGPGLEYWTEQLLTVDEYDLAIALATSDEFHERAVAQDISPLVG